MYVHPACLAVLFTLVAKTIGSHKQQMLTTAQPVSPSAERTELAQSALIVDEAQHEMWRLLSSLEGEPVEREVFTGLVDPLQLLFQQCQVSFLFPG